MWYIDVYKNDKIIVSESAENRADAIDLQIKYRIEYGDDAIISVTYDDDED